MSGWIEVAFCLSEPRNFLRSNCAAWLQVAELASLADQPHHRFSGTSSIAFDDALSAHDERTAIRVFEGDQPRAKAEVATLAEAAKGVGVNATTLQWLWAQHPDALAYLAYLTITGPKTCNDAAAALNWESMRAWQAEARLRAAGLVKLDGERLARVFTEEQPA